MPNKCTVFESDNSKPLHGKCKLLILLIISHKYTVLKTARNTSIKFYNYSPRISDGRVYKMFINFHV